MNTFKQAFDKITEAYIKGEIKVGYSEFCFCGTLTGGNYNWALRSKCVNMAYTYEEFGRMERALFSVDPESGWEDNGAVADKKVGEDEDLLFAGMTAALEVLKQIHIERGEVIDESPVFSKRTGLTRSTNL